jgi:hypothetical protein
MAVQTPTVNRERAQNAWGTATLPPFEFTTIHNLLAGGNGDSQLYQVRFTTLAPRFTTLFTTFGRGDGSNGDLCREIAVLTVCCAHQRPSSSPSTTSRSKSRKREEGGWEDVEYAVLHVRILAPSQHPSLTSIAHSPGSSSRSIAGKQLEDGHIVLCRWQIRGAGV